MSDDAARLARRHNKRPLRDLTDNEVDVLSRLGSLSRALLPWISEVISDLSELAIREAAERDMEGW